MAQFVLFLKREVVWLAGEGEGARGIKITNYKQKVHVFTTKIGSKMHIFESIFPNFLGGMSPHPLV